MGFRKRELVKTIEIIDLFPKGDLDVSLSARIEFLKSESDQFYCNIFFLESYKVIPTSLALNAQRENRDPYSTAVWCDKSIYCLEEALGFEELECDSVSALEKRVFERLEELFLQEP